MQAFKPNPAPKAKPLMNGTPVPAGQTAEQDMANALDNIFTYPSIRPFVCKQLIEDMVKSNPTPQYVQRVVTVFDDDGNGTRGNLQAVIKAILMDTEARAGDFQVFPTGTDPKEGHLREPVLFMTSMMRALNSTDSGTSLTNQGNNMGQNILTSPTVFNFFPPDYVIPQNYFSPIQSGLFGPDFALEPPATAVTRANFVGTVVFGSLRSSVQTTLNSYTSLASNTDPTALFDALNFRLMHGQMSQTIPDTIDNAVKKHPKSQH